MKDRPSLARRICDKMDAGELRSIAPLRLWGGFGTGNPCDACGEPIHPSQLEHEYRLDAKTTTFRFHIAALAWQAELKRAWRS